MANEVNNNNYLTIVFRYTNQAQKKSTDISNFVSKILSALRSYETNRSSYEASFDLFGVYVDPDEMSIKEQNDMNQKIRGSFEYNN